MVLYAEGLLKKQQSELFKAHCGEVAEWTVSEHLLADAINILRVIDYHLMCANSDKPSSIPKPELLRHPGAENTPDEGDSEAQLKAQQAEMRSVPAADLKSVLNF